MHFFKYIICALSKTNKCLHVLCSAMLYVCLGWWYFTCCIFIVCCGWHSRSHTLDLAQYQMNRKEKKRKRTRKNDLINNSKLLDILIRYWVVLSVENTYIDYVLKCKFNGMRNEGGPERETARERQHEEKQMYTNQISVDK